MDLRQHILAAQAGDGEALARAQEHYARQVSAEDGFSDPVSIAGVDVAYHEDRYCAAVCTLDLATLECTAVHQTVGSARFPYRPGLFAYRELPAVLDAFEGMATRPDLILFDGNGQLHPRRCGAACYLGLALDRPVIGLSKNPPSRHFDFGRALERGAYSLIDDPALGTGMALCTKDDAKPVFVSVGHKISLESAREIVLALSRYRVPEPIRIADQTCRKGLKEELAG